MNKIHNKYLLAGYKFMLEFLLRHPRFIYSACRPFSQRRETIRKFRETRNLNHLCRNGLDKDCFAHDAAFSDSNYLAKRTIS